MGVRRTERVLVPRREYRANGYRVVYATSRPVVRSAVLGPCDIVLVETETVTGVTEVLRWAATMTRATCVGAVGTVPVEAEPLVDVMLDGPATRSTVERLTRQVSEREAFLRALEAYYRTVARGADERAVAAARSAVEADGSGRSEGSLRGLLDAICV